jgi:hypothetical protein
MENSTETLYRLIDGAAFIAPAIVILVGFIHVLRLLNSWILHQTIRKSIEAKSPDANALIDKINQPFAGPKGEMPDDDRNGLVLVAIGLAIFGLGFALGGEQNIRIAIGACLFPLFVGIALLVRRYLVKREIDKESGAGL